MRSKGPFDLKKLNVSVLALFSGLVVLIVLSNRWVGVQLCRRFLTSDSQKNLPLVKLDLKLKRKQDQKTGQGPVFEKLKPGVKLAAMSVNSPKSSLPRAYRPLSEIEHKLFQLKEQYPDIFHLEKIGESTALRLPLWAVRVSDHAAKREDEPRILFTGVHHAREPIGANICLEIMQTLCENYGADEKITNWVDEIEIWFVPVVNPDGYKYIMDNNLSFPWWRKNLRDNDGDGIFNPLVDGVDLNRNYDYNWREGGDGKPNSWFYRGRGPFSEKEIKAVRDLAMRENFVFGISYHSYGESILFPWGNFDRPPDLDLIVEIANEMASKIHRESGRGQYSILPLNGRVGQSSIWMYGDLRVLDYIIEVGTEYFPADRNVAQILKENLDGAFFLFDRILQTGIRGHVFDAVTHLPLLAEIEVEGFSADYVRNRMTDPDFGGFLRITDPGNYSIKIASDGYYPRVIKNVAVVRGDVTNLEVGLYPEKFQPATGNN